MSKVLITGGAGFIGSQTATELIKQGHHVRILDNLDHQVHGDKADWPSHLPHDCDRVKGSITDTKILTQSLKGIDLVYHFASLTGVGQSMYDLEKYFETNVTGTALLVELIIKNKFPIQKIILSSSRAVYGEGSRLCPMHGVFSPKPRIDRDLNRALFTPPCPYCEEKTSNFPTNEYSLLQTNSYYGLTKQIQEQILLQASIHYQLPVIILRYFNVYGSFQSLTNPYTGIISIFYSKLKMNKPIQLYEQGLPVRDFVHTSDVVQANLKALQLMVKNFYYFNVGSGESISLNSFLQIYKKLLMSESKIEVTDSYRVGDIFSCTPDLSLSRAILNFQAKIKLVEGLSEFIEWAKFQRNRDGLEGASKELKEYNLLRKIS